MVVGSIPTRPTIFPWYMPVTWLTPYSHNRSCSLVRPYNENLTQKRALRLE